jgi:hypothetical protein
MLSQQAVVAKAHRSRPEFCLIEIWRPLDLMMAR